MSGLQLLAKSYENDKQTYDNITVHLIKPFSDMFSNALLLVTISP